MMRKIVLLMFVIALCCNCGGGGENSGSLNNYLPPNLPTEVKNLQLISAEKFSDGRIKYVLGLPASRIIGAKDNPFVQYNGDNWVEHQVSDVDNDGYYEFIIITFDRYDVRLIYGGNKAVNSWADPRSDPLYSANLDCLNFDLVDCQIYKKGTGPNYAPVGNDDFIRFVRKSDTETYLCTNLGKVRPSDCVSNPYIFYDQDPTRDGWEAMPSQLINSSGWAQYPVLLYNHTRKFTYGGDSSSTDMSRWSWVDGNMASSEFYDLANNAFCIKIVDGVIMPCS